jgi:hypothetical protein
VVSRVCPAISDKTERADAATDRLAPARRLQTVVGIQIMRRFDGSAVAHYHCYATAHAMKLSHLADQIVKAAPEQMLGVQELYASLDFHGPRNAHLAIPDWHTQEFRSPEMERHEFLTGQEDIAGDVLVFHYCRHDGRMLLHECGSLAEAASLVLGGAGVFNVFIDLVLVFEHFRLRPYRASYRDQAGARVVFDGRHTKDDVPLQFPERHIEWLELVA